jgi:hypothetical protein
MPPRASQRAGGGRHTVEKLPLHHAVGGHRVHVRLTCTHPRRLDTRESHLRLLPARAARIRQSHAGVTAWFRCALAMSARMLVLEGLDGDSPHALTVPAPGP